MSTTRLYRQDQYLIKCIATVTAIRDKDGFDVIACDQSPFYPEGGGQPSDIGTVSKFDASHAYRILRAYDESLDGDVWHITDAPSGTFSVGDNLSLAIDWNLRFQNMQRHLGEHMLSGTIYNLFGGMNAGFHMGEDYITIDISHPDKRYLTDDELALAEATVNEAIWANLPVTTTWFDCHEASFVMPVRKRVPHDGKVSIVTVWKTPNLASMDPSALASSCTPVSPDDVYDCIACCGTHASSSAEVGLLTIYKWEPNKGFTRIFFDCGKKAWERLSFDSRLLAEVAKRYSCSTADLKNRLDLEASSISSLKARLASLTSYVTKEEKQRILSEIPMSGSVYTYSTDLLSPDELLKLGFSVVETLREPDQESLSIDTAAPMINT